jgi:hypothetical protein
VKLFIKILFAFLFIITVPFFTLSLSLRFSQYSGSYLKSALDDQNVYSKLTGQLNGYINTSLRSGSSDNPVSLIAPFIQKEFTPTYFQGKINHAIDDTESWLTSKSATPPVLSFTDLKDKIINQNTHIVSQLESLETAYNTNKSQLESQMQDTGNSDSSTPTTLPEINISSWLKKDPVIPIGTYLGWLKSLAILSKLGPWILGALMTFDLILIAIVDLTPEGVANSWGWTLLLTAFWNGILYLLFLRFVPDAGKLIHLPVNIPVITNIIIPIVTNPFSASLARISPYVTLTLVSFGCVNLTSKILWKHPSFPLPVIVVILLFLSCTAGITGYQLIAKFPTTFVVASDNYTPSIPTEPDISPVPTAKSIRNPVIIQRPTPVPTEPVIEDYIDDSVPVDSPAEQTPEDF